MYSLALAALAALRALRVAGSAAALRTPSACSASLYSLALARRGYGLAFVGSRRPARPFGSLGQLPGFAVLLSEYREQGKIWSSLTVN